jgi:hypothetical protein
MLEQTTRARPIVAPPRADLIPLVQFYSIELSTLDGGDVSVGIMATLCEAEGDLIGMEVASGRVGNLTEALAFIESAVALPPSPLQ